MSCVEQISRCLLSAWLTEFLIYPGVYIASFLKVVQHLYILVRAQPFAWNGGTADLVKLVTDCTFTKYSHCYSLFKVTKSAIPILSSWTLTFKLSLFSGYIHIIMPGSFTFMNYEDQSSLQYCYDFSLWAIGCVWLHLGISCGLHLSLARIKALLIS